MMALHTFLLLILSYFIFKEYYMVLFTIEKVMKIRNPGRKMCKKNYTNGNWVDNKIWRRRECYGSTHKIVMLPDKIVKLPEYL